MYVYIMYQCVLSVHFPECFLVASFRAHIAQAINEKRKIQLGNVGDVRSLYYIHIVEILI